MLSSLRNAIEQSLTLRFIYWLFFLNLFDTFSMVFPVRRRLGSTRKRALFVKLDGIGDCFLWTSIFPDLDTQFPAKDYQRILVAPSAWKGLLDEETSIFERIIFVDRRGFAIKPMYRFEVMRQIRELGADIAIQSRLTRDLLWSDSVIRCCGSPRRVGTRGIANQLTEFQESLTNHWYTELVEVDREGDHELAAYKKFAAGLSGESLSDIQPTLPEPLRAVSVEKHHLPHRFAVVFPGAMLSFKRWPAENFVDVAAFVSETLNCEIVIAGGKDELEIVDEFARHFDGKFHDLVGKTSLRELFSIINLAEIVVTNDTVTGHFAAAAKRPHVVITPGFHVGRFFPYPESLRVEARQEAVTFDMPCFGCNGNCIYTDLAASDPKPCISNISSQSVKDAIGRLTIRQTSR